MAACNLGPGCDCKCTSVWQDGRGRWHGCKDGTHCGNHPKCHVNCRRG